MLLGNDWFRRRWSDGRTGHTAYLMFILTVVNFILILHTFLIEDYIFDEFTENLLIFTLLFTMLYFPVSILIGHWHRYTQFKVDLELKLMENPVRAKMFRTMLDVQTGRVSKEEIEEFRKFLTQIERKK